MKDAMTKKLMESIDKLNNQAIRDQFQNLTQLEDKQHMTINGIVKQIRDDEESEHSEYEEDNTLNPMSFSGEPSFQSCTKQSEDEILEPITEGSRKLTVAEMRSVFQDFDDAKVDELKSNDALPDSSRFITQKVRNHVPTDEDSFIRIDDDDWQRLIYGEPMELHPREIAYLQQFDQYVKENNLPPLPKKYQGISRELLKHLQSADWNNQKTYDEIVEYDQWVKMTFPIDPTPFKDFLKSGALYYAGRAKKGL